MLFLSLGLSRHGFATVAPSTTNQSNLKGFLKTRQDLQNWSYVAELQQVHGSGTTSTRTRTVRTRAKRRMPMPLNTVVQLRRLRRGVSRYFDSPTDLFTRENSRTTRRKAEEPIDPPTDLFTRENTRITTSTAEEP